MLNERDRSIIDQYVNEKYFDRSKLTQYLSIHQNVGNEVFNYCVKDQDKKLNVYSNWLDNEFGYVPVSVETFIRRIPFYFYIADDRIIKIGLHRILSREVSNKTSEQDLEQLYNMLEYMFYEKHLSLDIIFNYSDEQMYDMPGNWIFLKWYHYLKLCDELFIKDPTPANFFVRYNEILEASGLSPIIYEIEEYGYADMFFRSGDTIEFEGRFPCDKDGKPIMRWIGLDVKNSGSITCTSWTHRGSHLKVKLQPNTVIYALNCYNQTDDKDSTWYQIYAGPLTMEFDYEAIQRVRKRLKYTQKQVADAVGASVRTYQKWESGETTPDGHYLLRILNWLDMPDVQYVTRYIE